MDRRIRPRLTVLVIAIALLFTAACATTPSAPLTPAPSAESSGMDTQMSETATASPPATPSAPTAEEATSFVNGAETRLLELGIESNRASWVQANYITPDTQLLSAVAAERLISQAVTYAKDATKYDKVELPYETRRKLDLLKLALTAPAPGDPAKTKEMTQLASRLEAMYGEGKYCPPGKTGEDCLDIQEITRIFNTSRNPKELEEAWVGWHTISPAMRPLYSRFVDLSNEGARELGYKDTGTLWRSKYDMPPDNFSAELDRLWGQVRPLYESLHCYVRARLNQKYGSSVVPQNGPIPAHLLGNIWAQEWGNIYELVAPAKADPGYDLTEILKRKKVDAKEMVRYGERFFSSLGFEPLPETFWERSLFTKPRDREVVCHASAWDIDEVNDLRIKMCIEPTADDFRTIHHELGHNYYQRAYNHLPYLFRNSANDGFHEAIGDVIALSVTPKYLKQINLISKEPDPSKDIGLLMKDALDGVAFLPFGLLVDQWRWKVFSGEITPENYNQSWWDLRLKYQGLTPPVARSEKNFDPGAKYHVPANVPYTRYFLARILQYQFHRAFCQIAGQTGTLNRCTIYGNATAGNKLQSMLALGVSRPWPDALETGTGQRQMDATAIIDYFAPLKSWLDEQNKGRQCGW